jgi:hypothetical protein
VEDVAIVHDGGPSAHIVFLVWRQRDGNVGVGVGWELWWWWWWWWGWGPRGGDRGGGGGDGRGGDGAIARTYLPFSLFAGFLLL